MQDDVSREIIYISWQEMIFASPGNLLHIILKGLAKLSPQGMVITVEKRMKYATKRLEHNSLRKDSA